MAALEGIIYYLIIGAIWGLVSKIKGYYHRNSMEKGGMKWLGPVLIVTLWPVWILLFAIGFICGVVMVIKSATTGDDISELQEKLIELKKEKDEAD